jgi:hypothetical protein
VIAIKTVLSIPSHIFFNISIRPSLQYLIVVDFLAIKFFSEVNGFFNNGFAIRELRYIAYKKIKKKRVQKHVNQKVIKWK